MPINANHYKFVFNTCIDMDSEDIRKIAKEVEDTIDTWIDQNTIYDCIDVPAEIRRQIAQCVFDKIMSKEWLWGC